MEIAKVVYYQGKLTWCHNCREMLEYWHDKEVKCPNCNNMVNTDRWKIIFKCTSDSLLENSS